MDPPKVHVMKQVEIQAQMGIDAAIPAWNILTITAAAMNSLRPCETRPNWLERFAGVRSLKVRAGLI
jgi:hypothetical protein